MHGHYLIQSMYQNEDTKKNLTPWQYFQTRTSLFFSLGLLGCMLFPHQPCPSQSRRSVLLSFPLHFPTVFPLAPPRPSHTYTCHLLTAFPPLIKRGTHLHSSLYQWRRLSFLEPLRVPPASGDTTTVVVLAPLVLVVLVPPAIPGEVVVALPAPAPPAMPWVASFGSSSQYWALCTVGMPAVRLVVLSCL